MYLSRQRNYLGPRIIEAELGRYHAGGHQRIGVAHDSGCASSLGDTPARLRAVLHDPVEDTYARVDLVIEVFGSEEGHNLRVGTSSLTFMGTRGEPVGAGLARRLRPRDLETVAVMMHGRLSQPGEDSKLRPKRRPHKSKMRCFGPDSDGCSCLTEAEARDYFDGAKTLRPDGERAQRERIANAWWDAKIAGLPIGASVAKARGEDAPRSKAARNRANVYVADLRRRGTLAEVGRARGVDLAAYGVKS